MNRLIATILFFLGLIVINSMHGLAQQEIKVNPKELNVYSQGATTFLLTYGGLGDYRPAETTWCGDLIPASPDIGFKCAPGTIYGTLPARFDQSRLSGQGGYTDIVSVSPSVARRAYQAAARGEDSRFFYVRRFVSASGGPDQFVEVTLRMTGNGAGVPFSLTNVQLRFAATSAGGADPLVLFVKPGEKLPPIRAEITYTGTGRLKGRWEIVKPGDDQPAARDLLTEASLPIEERGLQRRFTELSRFNVYLPPGGKFILPGPESWRAPNHVAGEYLILLRIEATDDREADSDLGAVGAGAGVVHSGGVAGFPMPVLRYIVGGDSNAQSGATTSSADAFRLLLPAEGRALPRNRPVDFAWSAAARAAFYRLEIEDAQGNQILSALLPSSVTKYRAPSWLKDKAGDGNLRWRILALDRTGAVIGETPRRDLRLSGPN